MKKWIYNIFIVSILTMLIIGCTAVRATDLQIDSNNGNEHTESPPIEEKNIEEYIYGKDNKVIDIKPGKAKDKNSMEKDIDENSEEEKEKKEEKSKNDDGKVHYKGDGTKKLVALTFDDGPESKHTSQILDILDEYNIKATFFVLGKNAEKHIDVLEDIYNRGHEIGNHSWSHKYLPKISKESKKSEILKTEQLLIDTLGEFTPILRPPYGAVKKQDIQLISSLGYKIVNWSVDTRDWAGTPSEQMMKYVQDQLEPGGIILMHNSGNANTVPNMIKTLPTIIDWIVEQGYEFATVTEILN